MSGWADGNVMCDADMFEPGIIAIYSRQHFPLFGRVNYNPSYN